MKFWTSLLAIFLLPIAATSQEIELNCEFENSRETTAQFDRENGTITVGVDQYQIIDEVDNKVFAIRIFNPPEALGVPAEIGSLSFQVDNGRVQLSFVGGYEPETQQGRCFRPLF